MGSSLTVLILLSRLSNQGKVHGDVIKHFDNLCGQTFIGCTGDLVSYDKRLSQITNTFDTAITRAQIKMLEDVLKHLGDG